MRVNLKFGGPSGRFTACGEAGAVLYRLAAGDQPENGGRDAAPNAPRPAEREDLPYRVELWDEAKTSVEQVLAVTLSGSIGFAAYYAATREFPHRYITLRHKNRIVSRWNGPQR